MLKYYSYYSVGGYKDLFLGTSGSQDEATYYFPLTALWEEEAKTDETVLRQLQHLKTLPKIEQLSETNKCSLPDSARTLFSHGGYKLIYRHLEGETYALAIRNIANGSKDDLGRFIPFLFVITGEGKKDCQQLELLTAHVAENLSEAQKMIASCIGMNYDLDGLQFSLSRFNSWVNKVIQEQHDRSVVSTSGRVEIKSEENAVPLLILPESIAVEQAVEEQHLSGKRVTALPVSGLVSKDKPDELFAKIEAMANRLTLAQRQNEILKKLLIVTSAAGLVLGVLLAGLFH